MHAKNTSTNKTFKMVVKIIIFNLKCMIFEFKYKEFKLDDMNTCKDIRLRENY